MPFDEPAAPFPHDPQQRPLSSPQWDIYQDQRLKGDAPTYNIGGYLKIDGRIDAARFGAALREVIRAHDAFRLVLAPGEDGAPRQSFAATAPLPLELRDCSTQAAPHEAVLAWIGQAMNRPFALYGAPLIRSALIKLAEDRHYWFVCAHHLAADGWSLDRLFRALAAAYTALARGERVALAAPSYAEFVDADLAYRGSAQFARDRAYWMAKYADLPEPLLLPREREGRAEPAAATGELRWRLDPALGAGIDALAGRYRSTRFQVVLAAFYAFLMRLEQRDEVVIGLSVLNRKSARLRSIAGMFTNVMAARLRFDRGGSFAAMLEALAAMLRRDYRHQRFPIGELNRSLQLFERQRAQLYEASMSYEHGGGGLYFDEAPASVVKCTNDSEGTPLRLCMRDDLHGGEAAMHFIYGRRYFDEAGIAVLRRRFDGFLQALLASPEQPIAALPILTPEERHQLAVWNATAAPYPRDVCVHRLFERQAERTPQATALVHAGGELDYAELNARANRLAHRLLALGLRPDARVALCAERSAAMIVAVLAILKAGGAYLPLDPGYPAERLAYALEDAQPTLLLLDAAGRRALGARAPAPAVLDLDADAAQWRALSADNPQVPDLAAHHLAYVIYTSGSTGQPKGVMVEHRNVCHQVAALQRAYGLHARDRLLQFASLAFDMSVEEIFPALLSGAALVLRTDACLDSPEAFAAFCAAQRITSLNLPTAFWAQLATAQPELALPDTLRQVTFGGDAVSLPAVAAWLRRAGHRPRLINAYGPTETTVNATMLAIDAPLESASIGRPLANTTAYLLDAWHQPVPPGTAGELYIGGAGVARGYLHRPQLTEERFLPDPFAAEPGARMYRSGDLARQLPDGSLEFLGRNDHQVKIRGFRIELGEIEARLCSHASVREAVVVALGEGAARRLAAYVVAAEEGEDAELAAAWREHLAAALPDYMVPAAFVRLARFPLTPNGKLDRKALPEPGEQAYARSAYEPPQEGPESALAALWQELLGVERIGRHDHFFELGGHSLVAMRLLGRVGQQFGAALPLASLFAHPTLAGLAAAIAAAGRAGQAPAPLPPILPAAHGEPLPLSYAQQRLWFLAQLDPLGTSYHISLELELAGELDAAALRRSLDRLLARHQALRTVFHALDGQPVATLLPPATAWPLAEHDLRGEADAEAKAAALLAACTQAPYELARGPLVRAALVRLAERRHRLSLGLHHIVADGWSINLLAQEFGALYAAYREGRADPLPALAVQYPDYAAWQRIALTPERLQAQADYWRRTLAGAPERLDLPTDRPRPPRQSFAGAALPLRIAPELVRRLKPLCQQHGASLFMLFAAAWAGVLARLSGQDELVLGTLSANRGRREIEPLIGFFVSTLPLRLDLAGDPDAVELLARVRRAALDAQEHQDLPFEQVVEIASPARRLDHAPLFQVLFAWQSNDKSAFALPGLEVGRAQMPFDAVRYDLELHLYEQEDEAVVGVLAYATALFDPATVERHAGYLQAMLEAMAAAPAQPLSRAPLVGAQERLWLERGNATAAPWPQASYVHELFEAQAARRPAATALIHGDAELAYAELDARANRLARRLQALGAGPGRRVALCLERGFGMVAALLAVLKAGAAYVPLDPSYPGERLRQILAEADPLQVLADEAGRAVLGEAAAGVLDLAALETQAAALDANGLGRAAFAPPAEQLAYVIYTSGSTGTPKGVAMPHAPLVNLVHWQCGQAGEPAPRTLQFAALGFDVAFQEIFAALGAGAPLVLVDTQTRMHFGQLLGLLAAQRVQRVFLPYIALQSLAEAAEEIPAEAPLLPQLDQIIVAGEQLRLTAQIRRLFARLPGCSLHNHYGPTETHVVTALALRGAELAEAPDHVPIGRPIANARAYLLDRHGQPVPAGAAGELHIGGVAVARGYLGREDLTAERFLADPFDPRPGARMYRTGDLARLRADGCLVYLGRNDDQVKIRGFRIEPGEIEACLARHERVRECALLARRDARGEVQLIAYVVPQGTGDGLAAALHAHLAGLLPAYMVPAAFVTLKAIPLTAHGKLDRRALPAPDEQAFVRATYEAPRGELEIALAALWQELLGVGRVGRQDRFFELGGHSLVAVRLLSRVSRRFGVELPLATLFARPSLEGLAQALAERLAEAGEGDVMPIAPRPRAGALPISHAQRRLWFLAQLDGASAAYHIPLALRLDGALDVAALRRALDRLFARHESLRTVFDQDHGEPRARLLPATGLAASIRDFSREPEPEAALARFFAEQRNRPFDLAAGPLIRAALARLGERHHVLILTLHHIVADGWSLGILARELGAGYAADAAAAPLPIHYADYAAWEADWLASAQGAAQADYWRRRLAGAPAVLELPTDRPRPAQQDVAGAFLPIALDRELSAALKQLAQAHGATLFMLVLAAWAVVLSRLAGQAEVLIGTPSAGRGREELEPLIGFFVNTLALRIDLSAQPDTAALLAQVREVALEAQAHQQLPFERVVELAQVPRRLDRTPLVQVLFAWQSHDEGKLELPGIEARPLAYDFGWAKFELELILAEADGCIRGGLNYASALFERASIERHAAYLEAMLRAMVAGGARPLAAAPMLPAAERALLLDLRNRTAAAFPQHWCMHGMVEHWARQTPAATALVGGRQRLSYAAWNAQANRLAHRLLEAGLRSEQRVALCAGRGVNGWVALLAILKAGGAYVPLDPAYASARLELILGDAAPALLLCDAEGRAALGPQALAAQPVLDLDQAQAWADQPEHDPQVAGLDPGCLAYVIYTSGSTGRPKGVMVEHRGVINLAQSLCERFGVRADSRVSQFASAGFDASVFESVMALYAGAALYLAGAAERQSPAALLDFIGRERITHATLPPAFLQGAPAPDWGHRPMLILVGEASAPSLLQAWAPHAALANAYGPTEITVCATAWVGPDDPAGLSTAPIGRPLANTRLYLLDEHGEPVPQGSVGELYIGGLGVARGYLGRPELTAERFLPDPFDPRPGARMYRSGDLVRYLPDGNLVFLGRNDHQVKLRGYRIELGEIEAQLAAHPAVRESAVLAREDRPGEPRLVAYVAAEDAEGTLAAALRAYLGERLPDYMVPAAFVRLDALPLTAHGKLDRRALPAPDEAAYARRAYAPPQGEAELALAELWRELLGVAQVGRRDHFFELGGHSLLAVRLAARMHERFGTEPAVRELFARPVLEDMAALARPAAAVMRDGLDLAAEVTLEDGIRATAPARHVAEPRQVLLTGASGFLGAFLLASLLRRTGATVHCLVRCVDAEDGRARLDANLRQLGLGDYDRARVAVLPGDLAQPRLGLHERAFARLAETVEVIYHNGAWVNSLHTYASLKSANVLGTQEVLRLAGQGRPKHVHYVSTLSTIPPLEAAGPQIRSEAQWAEHWPALASGYAQSKWVAERLLRIGGERGIPYTVYRPTHIGASTTTGASNASDTWSLFLDACLTLRQVPQAEAPMNSLPVDLMAEYIVELSLRDGLAGHSLNLAHPHAFKLSELTRQVVQLEGLGAKYVDYASWRRSCEEHPGLSRLAAVMPADIAADAAGEAVHAPRFELGNAVVGLAAEGMACPPIGADFLRRYVGWRYRMLRKGWGMPSETAA